MNENIFRTGPPAWSLRAADRVDGPGVPGSSPGGGETSGGPDWQGTVDGDEKNGLRLGPPMGHRGASYVAAQVF
jgi:hypothetical protein